MSNFKIQMPNKTQSPNVKILIDGIANSDFKSILLVGDLGVAVSPFDIRTLKFVIDLAAFGVLFSCKDPSPPSGQSAWLWSQPPR
jgi:hypothetical protein